MKAPAAEPDPSAPAENQAPPESIQLSEGLRMLCQLALASAKVREWLRTQPPLAGFEPPAALVDKLVRAEFPDGAPPPASLLAELAAAEERFLSSLESLRAAPDPLGRAKSTVQGLQVQHLLQTIDGLKSRVADSSLPMEERLKFQKQILDLKIRVADVQRPFEQA
jgi:hypothetical protein